MRFIKIFLISLLALFIIYVSITILVFVLSGNNKAAIEKAGAQILQVDRVEIDQIFNFPLIVIDLKDVHIHDSKLGYVAIKKIQLFYDPFKLFSGNPVSSIRSIGINDVEMHTTLPGVFKYSDTLKSITNSGNQIPLGRNGLGVTLRNIYANIDIFGPVEGNLNIPQLKFSLSKNILKMDSDISLNIHLSNVVSYLQLTAKVENEYDITNSGGKGLLWISNMNAGGLSLAANDRIGFVYSNQLTLDLAKSKLSNFITQKDGRIALNIDRHFNLDYEQYKEFYFLEHIFPKGEYRYQLTADYSRDGFKFNYMVTPVIFYYQDWLQARFFSQNNKSQLEYHLKSRKAGNADLNFKFYPGTALPSGYANFQNLALIEGYRFGGIVNLISASKTSQLFLNDLIINNGQFGNGYTTIYQDTNGKLLFRVPQTPNFYNILMSGYSDDRDFDINLSLNGISGSAVVSNIQIDFLGISRTSLEGKVRVTPDKNNQPVIQGNITGYYRKQIYAEAEFIYQDMKLSFPKLNFPSNNLNFDASFNYYVPDKTHVMIQLLGNATFDHIYKLPMAGKISILPYAAKGSASIKLDGIAIDVDALSNHTELKVNAENYPLKRIGYPGSASLKFNLDLNDYNINSIFVDANYQITNRNFSFYFKSRKAADSTALAIQNFTFDTSDDKLFGIGKLQQTGGRLIGNIEFIRGGNINFSSSFEDIQAQINIKNVFIKNFPEESQSAFISTHLNLYGPLIFPDFNGSLKIVNATNSEDFLLDIPYISRSGDDLSAKSLRFQRRDIQINSSFKASQSGNGLIVSGDGDFNLFKGLKGIFSLNYFSITNQKSISYDIKSLSVPGKNLEPISGGIIYKQNRYTFFKKADNGLSGYLQDDYSSKEWSLELIEKNLKANFTGKQYNDNVNAKLKVQSGLDILSFFDFIRNTKGDANLDVSIKGSPAQPMIDGSLKIEKLNTSVPLVNSRIIDATAKIDIIKSRVVFHDTVLPTTSGKFLANGFVELGDFRSPYFNIILTPYDNQTQPIGINYSYPGVQIAGDIIIRNLTVSGTLTSLMLGGDITAENQQIQMNAITLNPQDQKKSFSDGIIWNLPIRIGNHVKFSNEFIDIYLRKDDMLTLLGSTGNDTFTIKGNTGLESGSLVYFGQSFTISEGTAYFSGTPGEPLPYVNLKASYRYKDQNAENVDIYLTFDGNVSKIMLRDFYSIPSKSKSELASVLGLSTETTSTTAQGQPGTAGQTLVYGGINVAENLWLLNPIAIDVKRRLGLDLLTFKTGLLENWTKYSMSGTNTTPYSLWEGTSLVVGKYVIPNVFVQYEMLLSKDPYSTISLVPLHTFGVDLDFRVFDFGWKYQPIPLDSGKGIKYEQKFEINLNRRF